MQMSKLPVPAYRSAVHVRPISKKTTIPTQEAVMASINERNNQVLSELQADHAKLLAARDEYAATIAELEETVARENELEQVRNDQVEVLSEKVHHLQMRFLDLIKEEESVTKEASSKSKTLSEHEMYAQIARDKREKIALEELLKLQDEISALEGDYPNVDTEAFDLETSRLQIESNVLRTAIAACVSGSFSTYFRNKIEDARQSLRLKKSQNFNTQLMLDELSRTNSTISLLKSHSDDLKRRLEYVAFAPTSELMDLINLTLTERAPVYVPSKPLASKTSKFSSLMSLTADSVELHSVDQTDADGEMRSTQISKKPNWIASALSSSGSLNTTGGSGASASARGAEVAATTNSGVNAQAGRGRARALIARHLGGPVMAPVNSRLANIPSKVKKQLRSSSAMSNNSALSFESSDSPSSNGDESNSSDSDTVSSSSSSDSNGSHHSKHKKPSKHHLSKSKSRSKSSEDKSKKRRSSSKSKSTKSKSKSESNHRSKLERLAPLPSSPSIPTNSSTSSLDDLFIGTKVQSGDNHSSSDPPLKAGRLTEPGGGRHSDSDSDKKEKKQRNAFFETSFDAKEYDSSLDTLDPIQALLKLQLQSQSTSDHDRTLEKSSSSSVTNHSNVSHGPSGSQGVLKSRFAQETAASRSLKQVDAAPLRPAAGVAAGKIKSSLPSGNHGNSSGTVGLAASAAAFCKGLRSSAPSNVVSKPATKKHMNPVPNSAHSSGSNAQSSQKSDLENSKENNLSNMLGSPTINQDFLKELLSAAITTINKHSIESDHVVNDNNSNCNSPATNSLSIAQNLSNQFNSIDDFAYSNRMGIETSSPPLKTAPQFINPNYVLPMSEQYHHEPPSTDLEPISDHAFSPAPSNPDVPALQNLSVESMRELLARATARDGTVDPQSMLEEFKKLQRKNSPEKQQAIAHVESPESTSHAPVSHSYSNVMTPGGSEYNYFHDDDDDDDEDGRLYHYSGGRSVRNVNFVRNIPDNDSHVPTRNFVDSTEHSDLGCPEGNANGMDRTSYQSEESVNTFYSVNSVEDEGVKKSSGSETPGESSQQHQEVEGSDPSPLRARFRSAWESLFSQSSTTSVPEMPTHIFNEAKILPSQNAPTLNRVATAEPTLRPKGILKRHNSAPAPLHDSLLSPDSVQTSPFSTVSQVPNDVRRNLSIEVPEKLLHMNTSSSFILEAPPTPTSSGALSYRYSRTNSMSSIGPRTDLTGFTNESLPHHYPVESLHTNDKEVSESLSSTGSINRTRLVPVPASPNPLVGNTSHHTMLPSDVEIRDSSNGTASNINSSILNEKSSSSKEYATSTVSSQQKILPASIQKQMSNLKSQAFDLLSTTSPGSNSSAGSPSPNPYGSDHASSRHYNKERRSMNSAHLWASLGISHSSSNESASPNSAGSKSPKSPLFPNSPEYQFSQDLSSFPNSRSGTLPASPYISSRDVSSLQDAVTPDLPNNSSQYSDTQATDLTKRFNFDVEESTVENVDDASAVNEDITNAQLLLNEYLTSFASLSNPPPPPPPGSLHPTTPVPPLPLHLIPQQMDSTNGFSHGNASGAHGSGNYPRREKRVKWKTPSPPREMNGMMAWR